MCMCPLHVLVIHFWLQYYFNYMNLFLLHCLYILYSTRLIFFGLRLWGGSYASDCVNNTTLSFHRLGSLSVSIDDSILNVLHIDLKLICTFWFKLIYLKSIAKQVIPTYINHSQPLIPDGIHLFFERGFERTYLYLGSLGQKVIWSLI